ncbi:MAG: DUF4185 domain-containing protein [Candidatus Eremiobacteraeota bacterium]|nr:DUF4185 domain-containing protein [Candidatus Eremiobacteraeota bacterium]
MREKLFTILAACFFLVTALPSYGSSGSLPGGGFPYEVTKGEPFPALSALFRQDRGWTGADGAYSIPLDSTKSLWFFGDTYIGEITGGRRVNHRLINNTIALQPRGVRNRKMWFDWKEMEGRPRAWFVPAAADEWYWPGDGAMAEGMLYLFFKRLAPIPDAPAGFQFDWKGDDLIAVENPRDDPFRWCWKTAVLPSFGKSLHFGTACAKKSGYLYVYGLQDDFAPGGLRRLVVLSRIPEAKLRNLEISAFEYLCSEGGRNSWKKKPENPATLFEGGATEMTVSQVKGVEGFIATYTPDSFGPRIVIRHAFQPEGPWSEACEVYRCPEEGKGILLYGAKAHPELSEGPGDLVITYCRNTGSLERDVTEPYVYFPEAIKAKIAPR